MAGSKVPKDPTLSPEMRRFLDDVERRLTASGSDAFSYGKHTIWVPAVAMTPQATNGAARSTITAGDDSYDVLLFDPTTEEGARFSIGMPKSWDEGTITFVPYWSHAATVTNFGVAWYLQAAAVSNDEGLNVTLGTPQGSEDTGGTTDDLYVGPESAAITVGGTPAEGDLVVFRIYRATGDADDTMAIDARLHGVKLLYTVNAANDT